MKVKQRFWMLVCIAMVLKHVPAAAGAPQPLSAAGAASAAEAQADVGPSYHHVSCAVSLNHCIANFASKVAVATAVQRCD
jgi:hypothetical protein